MARTLLSTWLLSEESLPFRNRLLYPGLEKQQFDFILPSGERIATGLPTLASNYFRGWSKLAAKLRLRQGSIVALSRICPPTDAAQPEGAATACPDLAVRELRRHQGSRVLAAVIAALCPCGKRSAGDVGGWPLDGLPPEVVAAAASRVRSALDRAWVSKGGAAATATGMPAAAGSIHAEGASLVELAMQPEQQHAAAGSLAEAAAASCTTTVEHSGAANSAGDTAVESASASDESDDTAQSHSSADSSADSGPAPSAAEPLALQQGMAASGSDPGPERLEADIAPALALQQQDDELPRSTAAAAEAAMVAPAGAAAAQSVPAASQQQQQQQQPSQPVSASAAASAPSSPGAAQPVAGSHTAGPQPQPARPAPALGSSAAEATAAAAPAAAPSLSGPAGGQPQGALQPPAHAVQIATAEQPAELSDEELARRTRHILQGVDMQASPLTKLPRHLPQHRPLPPIAVAHMCASACCHGSWHWYIGLENDSLIYTPRHCNAQVTTEKMIRKQLAEQTGEDMATHKAFIRIQVTSIAGEISIYICIP